MVYNVDETIADIQGLFVNYVKNRSISNLEALMSTIRKMLSELYHTCTTEEKEVFTKYLSNLEDIVHTTSI